MTHKPREAREATMVTSTPVGDGFISPVHNTTHMAKTVQLSDTAYAHLTAEKGESESYSDVILRLTGQKEPMRFVGRLKVREDFDAIMAAMRRAEVSGRRRLRA